MSNDRVIDNTAVDCALAFPSGEMATLAALDERLMMTTDIAVAYVSVHPEMPASSVTGLIKDIYNALCECSGQAPMYDTNASEPKTPAEVAASITDDHLVSFIDGKPYKALKRHLTTHGIDPQEYRRRYGLPADYPMVSASYSAARSKLAKDLGLGQQRRKDRIQAAA